MNFNVIEKNDPRESNYRLLTQPIKLLMRVHQRWCRPDGDGWEEVGGVCGVPVELETEEVNRQLMRVRGARKQRAARAKVPRESIRVVPLKQPVRMVQAVAQFEGISEEDARLKLGVVGLEEQIKKVLGLVNLQKKFEGRRTK
jgi:hypothetical protein